LFIILSKYFDFISSFPWFLALFYMHLDRIINSLYY